MAPYLFSHLEKKENNEYQSLGMFCVVPEIKYHMLCNEIPSTQLLSNSNSVPIAKV